MKTSRGVTEYFWYLFNRTEASPNIFDILLTEPKHTEAKAKYSTAEAEPNFMIFSSAEA